MVTEKQISNSIEHAIKKVNINKCKSDLDSSLGVYDRKSLYKYLKDTYNLKSASSTGKKGPSSRTWNTLTLKDGTKVNISKDFVEQDIAKWLKRGTATKWMGNLIEEYEGLPNQIKKNINTISLSSEFNNDGTLRRNYEGVDDYGTPIRCEGNIDENSYPYKISDVDMTITSSAFAGSGIGIKGKPNSSLERYMSMGGVQSIDIMKGEVDDVYGDGDDLVIDNYHKFSNTDYKTALDKNTAYKQDNGFAHPNHVSDIQHPIDNYGGESQNYYESGAMVMMGYKNPSNPNARIHLGGDVTEDYGSFDYEGGDYVDYKTFAKQNHYLAQYFIKEIYDKNVSIEALTK